MSKEIRIPTIQELKYAQIRRSHIIDSRKNLFGQIGTGKNQEATENNKGTMLWKPTIKVGRAKQAVSKSIGRLSETFDRVNSEVSSYKKAQEYLTVIAEEEDLISKARQLVEEGDLSEAEISHVIKDHEVRIEQAKNDPDIQRGLDRMKREQTLAETANKQEPPQKSVEPEVATKAATIFQAPERISPVPPEEKYKFTLTNGKIIKGQRARLLQLLNSAQPVSISRLAEIFPDFYQLVSQRI